MCARARAGLNDRVTQDDGQRRQGAALGLYDSHDVAHDAEDARQLREGLQLQN